MGWVRRTIRSSGRGAQKGSGEGWEGDAVRWMVGDQRERVTFTASKDCNGGGGKTHQVFE